MYVIGRGRYAREAYPSTGGVAAAAAAALTNRYLISPVAPGTPSPFTATAPAFHIVAAVTVTRRASGFFVLSAQTSALLAGVDTQAWSAVALFGATATGGVPNGQWLLDIASTITPVGTVDASPMAADVIQSDLTTLQQNATLVGINAKPVPQGESTIIVGASTVGATQITPGLFFGSVFELP